jgi:hypothetical protein
MANVIKYNITTNFNTYSEDFTQGTYSTISVSKTPNSVVTPFGNTNSTLVSRLSTTTNSYISKTMLTSETRKVWTLSVYAKLGTVSTNFGLRCQGGYPNRGDALFNLSTGTLIGVSNGGTNTSTSGTITPDVDGWYRCTVTTTFSGTSSSRLLVCSPTALNSVSGFEASDGALSNCYIYGVQLELGSVATTYIPTTTTSASGSNNPLINAIQSGNFAIGVNQGGYGLTAATGYWNGKTPNVSGYTIYQANGFSSPILYAAANDAELIVYSNQLGGSGNSTIGQALTYFRSSSAMTCVNVDYSNIVTSGLTLNLDAGFTPSYPRTGTTWTDISGNVNNGALINGPVYSGENSGCIVFDGVDDYISTPIQNLNRPCTFSMWVNLSSLTGYQTFFGQDTSQSILRGRFYFQKPGGTAEGFILNKVNFSIVLSGGGVVPVNSNNVIVTNIWYNYTAVLTTTTISLYENGILQNTVNDSNTFLTPNTTITLNAGYYNNSIVDYINGKSSSFLIYNRALSTQEVLQNYYAGLQRFIPTDSLVLYLDGNNTNTQVITPTIANDISGNNKNGTLVNGVTLSRNGQRSFLFDGIDDKVTTTLSTLNTSSTWTLWINRTQSVSFYNMFMGMGLPYFGFRSDGVIQFTNSIGGTQRDLLFNPSLSNNVWYNFTFVSSLSDGNTTMMFYLNGVLQTQSTFAGQQATTTLSSFTLGDWTLASYPFKGNIGNVRIYNSALTTTEILTIYTAGKQRYGL